jgi:uncharacterized membrane protein YdjX (TVP38/TMEM64 family)
MKKWFKKYQLFVIGSLVGGLAGYLYYAFIGCSTGTCRITSSPINSTLYFATVGAFLMGTFKKEETKNARNNS